MQTDADKFQSNNLILQYELHLPKGNTRPLSQPLSELDCNDADGQKGRGKAVTWRIFKPCADAGVPEMCRALQRQGE